MRCRRQVRGSGSTADGALKPTSGNETDVTLRPLSYSEMEPHHLADLLLELASESIRLQGHFAVVVAGGTTPRAVYEILRDACADWESWTVVLSDDRCLDSSDPARNENMVRSSWIDHVPVKRFIAPPPNPDPTVSAAEFANAVASVGVFDVCVLGLGADGHTAGLFSSEHLSASGETIGISDAPEPYPRRVSLSSARLSRARQVIFVVGPEKADVAQALIDCESVLANAISAPQRRVVMLNAGTLRVNGGL